MREGRLLAGPETLQINLGDACQLDCVFCWNHSPLLPPRPAAWARQRLSDAHLEAVIRALPQLRPGHALLSGRGDPLLHPRVEELLAALQRCTVPVVIQTNGVGGPSPERLVALGVHSLQLNLSAATPAGYARTHPANGERLARVLERLERLTRLAGAPRVTLVAVIQRSNAEELEPLVELAARIGAAGLYLKGMELVPGLEPLLFDDDVRAAVAARLETAQARALARGVQLDAEHLAQVLRQRTVARPAAFTHSLAKGPCYMGWYYLRVTSAGEVMFCCKDKRVGHLDERPLYDIWRAAPYHLLRLAGRDGDGSAGLFDDKCRACSNFEQNLALRRALAG